MGNRYGRLFNIMCLVFLLASQTILAMEPHERPQKKQKVEHSTYDLSLHKATVDGDLETVKKLLAQNSSIDVVDDQGDTSFTALIRYMTNRFVRHSSNKIFSDYLEILKLLLEAGSDPNHPLKIYSTFYTPLEMVIWRAFRRPNHGWDYYEMAELLLQYSADPNRVHSAFQETPLHVVMRAWTSMYDAYFLSFLALLLSHGANPKFENRSGITPLKLATNIHDNYPHNYSTYSPLEVLVLHGARISKSMCRQQFLGYPRLIKAILQGKLAKVKYVLKNPKVIANLFNLKTRGLSPVQWAFLRALQEPHGHEIFRLLLSIKNINTDIAIKPKREVHRLSLAFGLAAHKISNQSQLTLFELAIALKRHDLLLVLLEAGISVDVIGSEGNSPLHCAVIAKNEEAVKALLAFHANILLKNKKKQTAAQVAQEEQCKELRNLILDYAISQTQAALEPEVAQDNQQMPILGSFGRRIKELSSEVGYILSNLPAEIFTMIMMYTLDIQQIFKL
jgi:ankyrin repeat protein